MRGVHFSVVPLAACSAASLLLSVPSLSSVRGVAQAFPTPCRNKIIDDDECHRLLILLLRCWNKTTTTTNIIHNNTLGTKWFFFFGFAAPRMGRRPVGGRRSPDSIDSGSRRAGPAAAKAKEHHCVVGHDGHYRQIRRGTIAGAVQQLRRAICGILAGGACPQKATTTMTTTASVRI